MPWNAAGRGASALCKTIYDSMGWDADYAYRIPCQTVTHQRLPPKLAALPEEPNRNVDELSYAYWLGYIYRCECLLHEESSRMVYGAFQEPIMREAYRKLMDSPMGQMNLVDTAPDICAELDRLLVEKIWPANKKRQQRLQEKELERPNRKNDEEDD